MIVMWFWVKWSYIVTIVTGIAAYVAGQMDVPPVYAGVPFAVSIASGAVCLVSTCMYAEVRIEIKKDD